MRADDFKNTLLELLDETFEHVHGHYLDKNTSLFETLAGISSDQASLPVGGGCASLAAQAKHAAFYLDVLEQAVRDPHAPPADWGEIWRTVGAVTPDEWQAIQAGLRAAYRRTRAWISAMDDWPGGDEIGAALGILAHSAYHLGEIRQALCILRA